MSKAMWLLLGAGAFWYWKKKSGEAAQVTQAVAAATAAASAAEPTEVAAKPATSTQEAMVSVLSGLGGLGVIAPRPTGYVYKIPPFIPTFRFPSKVPYSAAPARYVPESVKQVGARVNAMARSLAPYLGAVR